MRIEFVYTEDDLRAGLNDFAERSSEFRSAKRQSAVAWFLFVVFLASSFMALFLDPRLYIAGIIVGLVVYLYLLESRVLNKCYVKRTIGKKNIGAFGDCVIEIDPEKLATSWPGGSLSHHWANLQEIVSISTHTFFYIVGNFIVILPIHSIKTGNYEAFIDQANTYFESSRDKTP